MKNDLIIIEQDIILKEKFKEIGLEIDKKVKRCQGMEVSESNYKDIKKIRAGLNKEKKAFEDEFKDVKARVLAPWQEIEQSYKDNIKNKYAESDIVLKEKISVIEDRLKAIKREEIESYFNEYCKAQNIDFVTFEQTGIKVGLADSVKSLKQTAKAFIDRIGDDLALIDTQVAKAAIMAEYKVHLNVAKAIRDVTERLEREEKEKELLRAKKERQVEEKAHEEKVMSFAKPTIKEAVTEEEEPAETYIAFKVYGNLTELQKIVKFLNFNKYRYEQI